MGYLGSVTALHPSVAEWAHSGLLLHDCSCGNRACFSGAHEAVARPWVWRRADLLLVDCSGCRDRYFRGSRFRHFYRQLRSELGWTASVARVAARDVCPSDATTDRGYGVHGRLDHPHCARAHACDRSRDPSVIGGAAQCVGDRGLARVAGVAELEADTDCSCSDSVHRMGGAVLRPPRPGDCGEADRYLGRTHEFGGRDRARVADHSGLRWADASADAIQRPRGDHVSGRDAPVGGHGRLGASHPVGRCACGIGGGHDCTRSGRW